MAVRMMVAHTHIKAHWLVGSSTSLFFHTPFIARACTATVLEKHPSDRTNEL